MLGGRPALGRWLRLDEEGTAAPQVVLLSYSQWLTRWGGDPNVVGRTVRLNTSSYEIIGVMPRDFELHSLHPRWQGRCAIVLDPDRHGAFRLSGLLSGL
jgi:hypothetical protein